MRIDFQKCHRFLRMRFDEICPFLRCLGHSTHSKLVVGGYALPLSTIKSSPQKISGELVCQFCTGDVAIVVSLRMAPPLEAHPGRAKTGRGSPLVEDTRCNKCSLLRKLKTVLYHLVSDKGRRQMSKHALNGHFRCI